MVVLAHVPLALAQLPLSPPGALWFDALFGYGAAALTVFLVIRQEMNASNPPIQE